MILVNVILVVMLCCVLAKFLKGCVCTSLQMAFELFSVLNEWQFGGLAVLQISHDEVGIQTSLLYTTFGMPLHCWSTLHLKH